MTMRSNEVTQNAAAHRGRDRLSELPDDILLNILERARTLDALRTCILSKRLMRLPAMLSRFNIDISSLTRHHDTAYLGFYNCHIARYNNIVASVTQKILRTKSQEAATIIHKLRVRCYMRPDECLPITRAFASTMAIHKVEDAELVFIVEKPLSRCTYKNRVCYAKRFNTCLADCPAAFVGLTCLCLHNMRFGGQDIPNILNTCKRLKHLRLTHCDSEDSSVLLVEHDQLIGMIVEYGQFKAVHLSCLPKLQHLTCTVYWYSSLTFGYVPQLSKLSLGKAGRISTTNLQLSQLLANAPSISDLHINFKSEKIWVVPECTKLLTPVLRKLEILNLDNVPEGCDIAWTMFILEAAPTLRELCITVWDHLCIMVTDHDARRKQGFFEKVNVEWQPSASCFKHKNLANLTIHGFQPDENSLRYVSRVMEVAVNMGEISLHDRKAYRCCRYMDPNIKVCPSTYPTTSEEKDMLRVEMTRGLEASPSVIHFRS